MARHTAWPRLLICWALSLFTTLSVSAQTDSPDGATAAPVLESHTLSSKSTAARITYHLYLPPAYTTDTERRFPVIYWLHGSGGYPPGVLPMLAGRFARAIAADKMPPALVVFLDDGSGRSMWVDAKDKSVDMETMIVTELLPHLDANYRTLASPAGRLLEGGSMGGYGVARLGLKFPELFGAVSMISGGPLQEVLVPADAPLVGARHAQRILDDVYGGDPDYFRELSPWHLAEQYAADGPGDLLIRIIVGGGDEVYENNRRFAEHLEALDISHTFHPLAGVPHLPKAVFAALGDDYWTFFAEYFSDLGE
ncbi:MAG: alpha/beta hydrolase-fold protein [Lewinella sp.]